MFTTARLMETWAHAQEIYDLILVGKADFAARGEDAA